MTEPFLIAQRDDIRCCLQPDKANRHGLITGATGTGKTVMAALDYATLAGRLGRSRLLFIAHREEILDQSLATFRYALRDASFGEKWVGGARPTRFDHVFASIQSLHAGDLDALPPDHFDVVIVDEFHHAAATSYRRILDPLQPVELLGLTATPERSDGLPILQWFDDRIAAELRLWEAIDQQHLSPFLYFGIHDGLDLREIPWRRGRGYYAEAPWRGTWKGERGGSVLTHSIHIHDLLTWIGGPLAEVRALTATRVNEIETEDCAVAVGRTLDGGLVSMNVSLGAATESSRLVWCFEHVTIESSTSPYDPAAGPWSFDFKKPAMAEAAERVFTDVAATKPLFTGQFQGFVDALRDDRPFPITLDDAQASLELVTAWYRSARTGSVEALLLPADPPARASWPPAGLD